MAEIEFFATQEEIVEVVTWLLAKRCVLVPDMHYESANVLRLAELAAIRRIAETTPHFFAIREDLLESPLSVNEVQAAEKHFFYIDPRTGGPSLQFYWGRRSESQGEGRLSASWLSYYGWYVDSVTGERKEVPRKLLEIYSECGKEMRAKYRKIRPSKREFLISPNVEQLVRRGTHLVGLEGMMPQQILGN